MHLLCRVRVPWFEFDGYPDIRQAISGYFLHEFFLYIHKQMKPGKVQLNASIPAALEEELRSLLPYGKGTLGEAVTEAISNWINAKREGGSITHAADPKEEEAVNSFRQMLRDPDPVIQGQLRVMMIAIDEYARQAKKKKTSATSVVKSISTSDKLTGTKSR